MTDYSSKEYLNNLDAYWRAANYVSVGQLYLKDNPLLTREVVKDDIKINPIGHWGTISGQNLIYAHLNRIINKYDVNMFYVEGPGHGGQVMVSNSYLDGSYTELYPEITEDVKGMTKLFKQFSFPGGIASHAAPETPGSIHEGGELGYSLSHSVGAILDNPDQIAATVIGDGESETGPLAASWFSNVFINPVTDGAVLPILDLNGFKISNPTILSRKSDEELTQYFEGMGWDPMFFDVTKEANFHEKMAEVFDAAIEKIQAIQKDARAKGKDNVEMPHWPVIIARIPKGLTGPKEWDGAPIENSFRAHQVPIPVDQNHMDHIDALVDWLKSYKPEELFDENGKLIPELAAMTPKGNKRMAMNPITNGGIDPQALKLPNFEDYALKFDRPGDLMAQDMIELGKYLRDVIVNNPTNFRMFGPDETMSNRLGAMFEASNRQWLEDVKEPNDQFEAPAGRILDAQLSEHQAEGWLEGYTLTGRRGIFASYESFLRVVDSMLTQHFKWLRKAVEQEWRNDYPSLNVIATSTAFQQDHNGYTHQDPGIITHLAEKKPEFMREYFPADANSLLAVMPQVLSDYNKINLVVTSKHPRNQFYSMDEAKVLVKDGLKIIDWASNDDGDPDIVIAAAGTEPNLESLAAISILREKLPNLKIRFINVMDLLKLRSPKIDPRGLTDEQFNEYFTVDKPVLFAFHGFEGFIKDIFFDRDNHNLSVHGYRENGDITTPFDMRVVNEMDRFHIAEDVAVSVMGDAASDFADEMEAMVDKHMKYTREFGDDLPEVKNWKW